MTARSPDGYRAKSGTLVAAYTVEVQTLPHDVDRILDAVLEVHHYEEPVIFVRQDWMSRAKYDPTRNNPHRWWNDGRGLPERLGEQWPHPVGCGKQ